MELFSARQMPQHLALILDGNGRWAKKHQLPRSQGHKQGGETLKRLLEDIIDLGIPVISLYAFSVENWRRPLSEVCSLWKLLAFFFQEHLVRCKELGIRIRISGDLSGIPLVSRKQIEKSMAFTHEGTKLVVNFCVNYGSQQEILRACEKIIEKRLALDASSKQSQAAPPLTKEEFEEHLYTKDLPPVDLLIRPGGESRLSNFLLWQCAYAEIYLTDTLWPDFCIRDIHKSLEFFRKRNRRFGALGAPKSKS